MSVRSVLRMGDPRLLEPARDVEAFGSPELHALIRDLQDTMASENGAGLAAVQIGVGLRVVVFGYQQNPRYPEAPPVPETVLINPSIEPLGEETEEDWEGCLSVPGLRGRVSRYSRIRYTARDPEGVYLEREAEGFHARVVQHECDHLDGILYPRRIRDLRYFGFTDELLAAGLLPGAPCDD